MAGTKLITNLVLFLATSMSRSNLVQCNHNLFFSIFHFAACNVETGIKKIVAEIYIF